MTLAVVGTGIFAPSFTVAWLWLGALCTVAFWLVFQRTRGQLMPSRTHAEDRAGALRSETPAVVNLLTNDATVTAAGFRATMIDLAARGWLRILPPEDDLEELARVRPAATAYKGDALRPHERLVLQHVMARFTTDRAIPARYLAVDIRGGWWKRFSGLVTDDAVQAGLIRRRWTPRDVLIPALLWTAGALCWIIAWSSGHLRSLSSSAWCRSCGSKSAPNTPIPTTASSPPAAGLRFETDLQAQGSRISRPVPSRPVTGDWRMHLRCAWQMAQPSNSHSPARTTTAPGAASVGAPGWCA